MGSQAIPGSHGMVPHPGTIVFRQMWNHSEHTQPVDSVPEPNRFVYYDANGSETSSHEQAVSRVPIVEVELSSFDANGRLVEPAKAVRFGIAEYGPDHKFLRHTSGR